MTKEIKVLLFVFLALIGGIVYLEMEKRSTDKPIEPFKEEVKLVEPPVAKPKAPEPPKKVVVQDSPKPVQPKPVVNPPIPPKPIATPSPVVPAPIKPEAKSPVTPPAPKPVVVAPPKPAPEKLQVDVVEKVEHKEVVVNATIPKFYVVKNGDILSRIAEKELGSVHFVPDIRNANPEMISDFLVVGAQLVMPERDVLVKRAKAANDRPGQFNVEGGYEIKKGDNLYSIAKEQLGSSKRVSEILDLNPGLNPHALRIGDKIKLPK